MCLRLHLVGILATTLIPTVSAARYAHTEVMANILGKMEL